MRDYIINKNKLIFFVSDVEAKFVAKLPANTRTKEGQSFAITCEVSKVSSIAFFFKMTTDSYCKNLQETATVVWLKDNKEMVESPTAHIVADGTFRKLIFDKLTIEDSATYTCKLGDTVSQTKLTVEGNQLRMLIESLSGT